MLLLQKQKILRKTTKTINKQKTKSCRLGKRAQLSRAHNSVSNIVFVILFVFLSFTFSRFFDFVLCLLREAPGRPSKAAPGHGSWARLPSLPNVFFFFGFAFSQRILSACNRTCSSHNQRKRRPQLSPSNHIYIYTYMYIYGVFSFFPPLLIF